MSALWPTYTAAPKETALTVLLGCLFIGACQPLVKRWHADEPVAVMTFWVIVMAAVLLLLFVLLAAAAGCAESILSWPAWQQLPASVYWRLAYLALFTTLLSFFLQQLGALPLGAARPSAYSLLTPVFVMAISFLLEPQRFSWALMPGCCWLLLVCC